MSRSRRSKCLQQVTIDLPHTRRHKQSNFTFTAAAEASFCLLNSKNFLLLFDAAAAAILYFTEGCAKHTPFQSWVRGRKIVCARASHRCFLVAKKTLRTSSEYAQKVSYKYIALTTLMVVFGILFFFFLKYLMKHCCCEFIYFFC